MEKKKAKGIYSDSQFPSREEELELEYELNALEAYKKVIDFYNNSLRPMEVARTAISCEWIEDDSKFYCEFVKQNMFTIMAKGGHHDLYKCKFCNKKVKRYTMHGSEIKNVECKKRIKLVRNNI